jgi:hypothetical protein
MTEFELFQALRPLYPAREYALLPQVANGTGAGSKRHCDALALSLWPSRGLYLTGFEMKSYIVGAISRWTLDHWRAFSDREMARQSPETMKRRKRAESD